jgi:exopolysaccharide production protein ExoZ
MTSADPYSAPGPAKSGVLRTLQAGRALAALGVVAYHLNGQMAALGAAPVGPFAVGWCGVDFFFVLSGFIIWRVHAADLGRPDRLMRYLRNRWARLYPIYWIVLAVVVAALLAVPSLGTAAQRDPLTLASSALLVPAGRTTVLGQAWTLYHEVLFYALFGLAIARPRIGAALGLLWMAACAVRALSLDPVWNEISAPLRLLTSPLNLLFGLGVLSGWALDRHAPRRPLAVAGFGVLMFLAAAIVALFNGGGDQPAVMHLALGAGAGLAILGLCAAELQGRVSTPAWLFELGGASYALYLSHTFAISLAAKVVRVLHAPLWLAWIGLAALAIAVGWGLHRLVERPLLRRLREAGRPAPSCS